MDYSYLLTVLWVNDQSTIVTLVVLISLSVILLCLLACRTKFNRCLILEEEKKRSNPQISTKFN